MTILYFNTALICVTEGTFCSEWDEREKRFNLVAESIELTYGSFGCTEAGRDIKSVWFILGKNPIYTISWLKFFVV